MAYKPPSKGLLDFYNNQVLKKDSLWNKYAGANQKRHILSLGIYYHLLTDGILKQLTKILKHFFLLTEKLHNRILFQLMKQVRFLVYLKGELLLCQNIPEDG